MALPLVNGSTAGRGHAVPPVSGQLLRRERVLHVLDEARDVPVLCLQAPGGYGKTTVLAQWLAHDTRPVIWLSVNPGAADAEWLARALLDDLGDRGLVSHRVPVTAATDPLTWHLSVLPAVEQAVREAAEPFVVAVDDAGSLTGTAWECLLESLASSLPAGAQLVLTTRDTVPPTLWRLQSRGQVVVIGPEVLAFDEAETRELMSTAGVRATTEHARSLLAETEGWPVAVYLSTLPRADGRKPWPRSHPGVPDGSGLAEYLREEVIGRLPADDAAFLSRCSVLSVLEQHSCDEVSSTTGSLARLRRLSAGNRLLSAQDDAGQRFRMHPLLAEALTEQLRENPEAWYAAHAAASRADERRGFLDGAVHHAKLAGDDDRLANLIWSRAPFMLASGRTAVLARWLEGVEDDRLSARCGLALSAAWTASHAGDMVRMHRFALTATQLAARDDRQCVLDADLLLATIGAHGLDHVEASARAFIHGKPVDDPWQTVAHYLLGVALFLRDESGPAQAALHEASRIAQALDLPVMLAHSLAALADIGLAEGRDQQALTGIREVRELAARHDMDTIATTAPIFTTSAVGYLHEGRFADARREAARALRLTALMRTVAPWHAVQGRLALAHLNVALGDPERARVLLDEARDVRGPTNISPRLDSMYAELGEQVSAVSTSLVGVSSLTIAEVRVLQYLPTHLTFPQIADELFVSRNTIKTQALSAYRKLGVHTRSEAIDHARRAGLLPPA
jgi:LuxR family maltose regulon positive regulatory protein